MHQRTASFSRTDSGKAPLNPRTFKAKMTLWRSLIHEIPEFFHAPPPWLMSFVDRKSAQAKKDPTGKRGIILHCHSCVSDQTVTMKLCGVAPVLSVTWNGSLVALPILRLDEISMREWSCSLSCCWPRNRAPL